MQSSAYPLTESHTEAPAASKASNRAAVRALYAFDNCPPERLIRICCLLQKRGYHGASAAYVMPHTRRFYLTVEEYPQSDELLPPTGILEEYGTRIAAASMLCCLDEHARCLCDGDAVAAIAALAL
ncbi:MAG: adaptor protein MecA [Clostridia bacterium]|nr:adaptor protein MecA [Clostridia bacterium]